MEREEREMLMKVIEESKELIDEIKTIGESPESWVLRRLNKLWGNLELIEARL